MCVCQYLHKSITLCVFVSVCVCVIKPVLCTQFSVYVNTLRYKSEKNRVCEREYAVFIYVLFFYYHSHFILCKVERARIIG